MEGGGGSGPPKNFSEAPPVTALRVAHADQWSIVFIFVISPSSLSSFASLAPVTKAIILKAVQECIISDEGRYLVLKIECYTIV